jgi:hypothetical protein
MELWKLFNEFSFVEGNVPVSSFEAMAFSVVFYVLSIRLFEAYMKDRKPMGLKTVATVHNFFLFALSVVMFGGIMIEVIRFTLEKGMFTAICDPDYENQNGRIVFWYYIFYLSKIYEFGDTWIQVIIILISPKNRYLKRNH